MNRNVYSLILILLAIGLYFTVTQGILDEAKVVSASNQEYITAIESASKLISVRDQVLAEYNKLSLDDRAKLDKIVPKSIDNIRLIIDLNNVALRHGFSLKGVSVTALSDNKNPSISSDGSVPVSNNNFSITTPVLEKVSVSFGLSAPYQQFISFIQDLEASLRILDVNSLSVTANDSGIYDWKIDLNTYWLRSQ